MRAKIASSKRHQEHHDKLVEKIQLLMAFEGEPGLAVKVALLSGLRMEEMVYAFCEEICDNSSCCISCKKLHVITKRNGMAVLSLNWVQSNKRQCYFTMFPTILWQQFRSLPAFNESNIKTADKIVKKSIGVKFAEIRVIFHQVLSATMNPDQLDILAGTASASAARNCLMLGIDEMSTCYVLVWEKAGVILPVL
jgi:intergrase/recombinase